MLRLGLARGGRELFTPPCLSPPPPSSSSLLLSQFLHSTPPNREAPPPSPLTPPSSSPPPSPLTPPSPSPSLSPLPPQLRRAKTEGLAGKGQQREVPSPFYSPSTAPPPIMDFSDFQMAYGKKSTSALLRSLVVLRLCQSDKLVSNAHHLLSLSEKVFGKRLTDACLKQTFFKHFCAGEDRETIKPTVQQLKDVNVRCILDYAAEADVTDKPEEEEKKAKNKGQERRGEERKGVVSARLYDYLGEEECDKNMEIFLTCMEAAADQENGFVAVKLTALCRPVLLERMTSLLLTFRELWTSHVAAIQGSTFDSHDYYIEDNLGDSVAGGGTGHEQMDPKIAHYGDMRKDVKLTKPEFIEALKKMKVFLDDSEYDELFEHFNIADKRGDKDAVIDYIEWNEGLNLDHVLTNSERTRKLRPGWGDTTLLSDKASEQLVKQLTELGYLPIMNEAESLQYLNFERRLHRIAEEAEKKQVRLLIDAEQTYLQTAIDHVTRQLQLKHNKEFPLVFGTYQCYLNWSRSRLEADLERAKRKGYWFAGKLVRGAYMVQERQRALSMGYPSPIMRTKTEVDYNYNACVEIVMQKSHRTNLMIASHNQYSIELAVGLMQKYNIQPEGGVFFAQLLGMTDNLTNVLGQQGFQSYKYLPYGRVGLVVPYLIRRAQENSGIMTSGATEKLLISHELKRRFFSWFNWKKSS